MINKERVNMIPSELASVLVVDNIVEYQSIERVRIRITTPDTSTALKTDYKNILKVFDKEGNIVWQKK